MKPPNASNSKRMKTGKAILLTASVIAIGAAVAGVWIVHQRQQRQAEAWEAARQRAARAAELDQLAKQSPPVAPPASAPTVSSQPTPEIPSSPQPTNVPKRPNPPAQPSVVQSGQPAPARRELQDPLARVALGMVGADADAEAYWLDAIYNPDLPDQEREDLMEDLNEDGLSDPRHPGPWDYPLIMNRITLIDQIVPTADQFMLPHLWEAYKDLWNLAEQAQGRGDPVR
jgi:type II secretory pathway pseudopilin PulG